VFVLFKNIGINYKRNFPRRTWLCWRYAVRADDPPSWMYSMTLRPARSRVSDIFASRWTHERPTPSDVMCRDSGSKVTAVLTQASQLTIAYSLDCLSLCVKCPANAAGAM